MDDIGAEVSLKIRSAIKAKLTEIGIYVDEELPDYVMVMVANKRSKEQMDDDLQLFLGKHTALFTTWLHQVLQKLQEVTVANLGGVKRKASEDTKKKKKIKSGGEKKELKKKIKVEPEDDDKNDVAKSTKASSKEKTDSHKSVNDDCDTSSTTKSQNEPVVEHKKKEKKDLKFPGLVKERKISSGSSKTCKQPEASSHSPEDAEGKNKTPKSQSEAGDLDDDDFINIRTDGELLDTTEEPNVEEPQKNLDNNDSPSAPKINKDVDKKHLESHKSVPTKEKQTDSKKHKSLSPSPPPKADKVMDARELLNRRKAAKQVAESENRNRKRSRDRSLSPVHKRKSDTRDNNKNFSEGRDKLKRSGRDLDRDHYRDSRDNGRDRKDERDRDSYLTKRRDDRAHRTDSNRNDRNEITGRRSTRHNNDDWNTSRPSKIAKMTENRKVDREVDTSGKRRDVEEPRKRSAVLSQVVPRSPEPEEDVDTPVPSVVKVTPRPRRPPSQQPSTTLIMKAISEANRSLANVPPRPDSTQQARKKTVFTRKLRQLQKIPPEKIAISISNPLALQNVGEKRKIKSGSAKDPDSPKDNDLTDKEAIKNHTTEVTSSEPDNCVQNDNTPIEEWENKQDENMEEDVQQPQESQEPASELDPPSTMEPDDETMEDLGPQFVVTLNGYDPDGLYSQSELDISEDADREDWLKAEGDQNPVLTSTPDGTGSPRLMKKRLGSPIVQINKPAVNHSNLIAVDIMKSKTTERCKYWPACRLADKCTFYHPTKPCKVFPACKFGDACLYIHPQCKFNVLCTRKDCVFSHTPVHTPSQPKAVPKTNVLYAASAPSLCKFYPNCANANCQFAHPLRACRYGLYCTKKDCSFDHGKVAPVEKLKWTRGSTT